MRGLRASKEEPDQCETIHFYSAKLSLSWHCSPRVVCLFLSSFRSFSRTHASTVACAVTDLYTCNSPVNKVTCLGGALPEKLKKSSQVYNCLHARLSSPSSKLHAHWDIFTMLSLRGHEASTLALSYSSKYREAKYKRSQKQSIWGLGDTVTVYMLSQQTEAQGN